MFFIGRISIVTSLNVIIALNSIVPNYFNNRLFFPLSDFLYVKYTDLWHQFHGLIFQNNLFNEPF